MTLTTDKNYGQNGIEFATTPADAIEDAMAEPGNVVTAATFAMPAKDFTINGLTYYNTDVKYMDWDDTQKKLVEKKTDANTKVYILTGGGAMMRHIQQLASFKTGLDVRIGYPNEHLSDDTAKELASPMYATGIGLVIEGIARAEHQERMERLASKERVTTARVPVTPEPEPVTEPEPEEETERGHRRRAKKERTGHKGLDLTQIITKFFSADEINE